jgi:catechol 2,3-dioxygenase-like lactoylglutathione lyase family enzyme
MLSDSNPCPTIAVADLAVARKFYEDTLGLTVQKEMEKTQLVVYESGNGSVQIYVSDMAGTNKATYVTWEVEGIEEAVEELKDKDVEFDHYPDMPEVELEGDIHVWGNEKVAWFKDPDGNVLCLHETTS